MDRLLCASFFPHPILVQRHVRYRYNSTDNDHTHIFFVYSANLDAFTFFVNTYFQEVIALDSCPLHPKSINSFRIWVGGGVFVAAHKVGRVSTKFGEDGG